MTPTPTPNNEALAALLDEVRQHFTRDDDLPNDLLPRIDAALSSGQAASPPAPRAPSVEPVGHVIEVEEHVSGTWGQKRRVRCVVWTGEPPAVGEALFLRVALPTAPASAGVEEFPLPEPDVSSRVSDSTMRSYEVKTYSASAVRDVLHSYSASLKGKP